MRVAVFFENLGPYHVARLNAANRVFEVLGVEWRGRSHTYGWDSAGYSVEFDKHTLLSMDKGKSPNFNLQELLEQRLPASSIDAVAVNGWGDFGSMEAIWWAMKHNLPIVVMSESTAWDGPRKLWKEWIKRRVIKLFSAALVGGTPHRDYMLQLGMPADRIFPGYDAVDNDYFAGKAAEIRNSKFAFRNDKNTKFDSKSDECHSTFPTPDSHFFLSSARFVEKKNLFRLIEAFAEYRKMGNAKWGMQNAQPAESIENHGRPDGPSLPWNLVLLGDGELRGALIARGRELGLNVVESPPWAKLPTDDRQLSPSVASPTVFLPGFIQYPELPEYYGRAGAFIHASTTEQWGLVVNEAMASGLPVIVSNRCGCAMDLVQEGVNGFTFDPLDIQQLARLMLQVSNFRFQLSGFGAASTRIISNWGPERFASGLKAAAEKALEAGPTKATALQRALLNFLINRKKAP